MHFDSIFPLKYCLNLSQRLDRRVRCEALFASNDLAVWRFPAIDATRVQKLRRFENAGRYAHNIGTRMMIRKAAQARAPAVFLFEDDVVFAPDWRSQLEQIELPQDWGIFYLGCQHHLRPQAVSNGLVRVRGALDTHAWGIRAEYYQVVLNALRGKHHPLKGQLPAADVLLAQLLEREQSLKAYSCFPNLAWQEMLHSDLVGECFSNYDDDGYQRPARSVIAGVWAEALSGNACSAAIAKAMEVQPFYSTRVKGKASPVLNRDAQFSLHADASTPHYVEAQEAVASQSSIAETPRLALLFLTRSDVHHPGIWEEYLADAGQSCAVYSHVADPGHVQTPFLLDCRIDAHLQTAWGDISLVRAMLALLRAAVTDRSNTHFAFVSETCVPIRSFASLKRALALDGRSRFHWQTHSELMNTSPDKARRLKNVSIIPCGVGRFQSQWLLLNREAATLCVEDDFTSYFETCWAPDEYYFATLLEMKGWDLSDNVISKNVTWMDWRSGGAHPRAFGTVTPRLASELSSSGCYFARKFMPSCGIEGYQLHRS